MDREYIISVIVQGRDLFSSILQDAAEKGSKALSNLRVEHDKLKRSFNERMGGGKDFFGGLGVGIESAVRGLRRLSSEAIAGERALVRMGYNIGYSLTNGLMSAGNALTKFRGTMALLIGVVVLLAQAIFALVGYLGALASAAAVAATGLAGALVAAIAQLIPVVGLLAAAMNRVKAASEAAALAQKANASASADAATQALEQRRAQESLENALYSLKQAHYSVADAQQHVIDSGIRLIDARREAARNLQNVNNAERDAILATRDAELALIEARERAANAQRNRAQAEGDIAGIQSRISEQRARIERARVQGDPNAIAESEQQLAIMQGNLQSARSSLPDSTAQSRANLDISQAEQRLKEAKISQARATQDANVANDKGVEKSGLVVQALRDQREANRALERALHNVQVQQRNVRDQTLAVIAVSQGVTTAQKAYNDALKELSPAERGFVQSLMRIKETWKRVSGPITDPIVASFARALDKIGEMLKDPKLRTSFAGLGVELGKSIDSLSTSLTSPGARKFFEFLADSAKENLPIFVRLLESLGKLFAQIAEAAAPLFHDLLTQFTEWVERGADKKDNVERFRNFFDDSFKYIGAIARLTVEFVKLIAVIAGGGKGSGLDAINQLTGAFENWQRALSTPEGRKKLEEFFKKAREDAQALYDVFRDILVLMRDIQDSKFLENVAKVFTELLLPALDKAFRILSWIASIIGWMSRTLPGGGIAKEFFQWVAAFTILSAVVPGFGAALRTIASIIATRLLPLMAQMLIAVGPVGWIAIAIGTLALLEAKFHFVERTQKWFHDRWNDLWSKLPAPVQRLQGIVERFGGMFGPGFIIKSVDRFADMFVGIIKRLRQALNNPVESIKTLFTDMVTGILSKLESIFNAFITAYNETIGRLGFLPGIPDKLDKVDLDGSDAKKQKKDFAAAEKIASSHEGGMPVPGAAGTPVTIRAHAGEWVLNAMQQARVMAAVGASKLSSVRDYIFGGTPIKKDRLGHHIVKPSASATKKRGDNGVVYAIDRDAEGNSITFVELKSGQWSQVAVTPAGEAARTPTHFSMNSNLLYRRSPLRQALGNLMQSGDDILANAFRNRHNIGYDFRDPGSRIAPSATGAGFAEGGVITNADDIGAKRQSKNINLGGLTLNTTQAEADVNHILRQAGMMLEVAY